jgi:hypothetical protein
MEGGSAVDGGILDRAEIRCRTAQNGEGITATLLRASHRVGDDLPDFHVHGARLKRLRDQQLVTDNGAIVEDGKEGTGRRLGDCLVGPQLDRELQRVLRSGVRRAVSVTLRSGAAYPSVKA